MAGKCPIMKWFAITILALIVTACVTQTVTVDSSEPANCVKKSQTILLSHVECTNAGGKVLEN